MPCVFVSKPSGVTEGLPWTFVPFATAMASFAQTPVATSFTVGPTHGKGAAAFIGAVLMPNDQVLFVPYNSPNIGLFNPSTNTYTDGPAHGKGSGAFSCGMLDIRGRVILVPAGSANVGIYNPVDNSYKDGPSSIVSGTFKFMGCCRSLNGDKIAFTPGTVAGTPIYIYNTTSDTLAAGPGESLWNMASASGYYAGTGLAFANPIRRANGDLLFPGREIRAGFIYNPDTGTSSNLSFSHTSPNTNPFGQSVITPNGVTHCFPLNYTQRYSVTASNTAGTYAAYPYGNYLSVLLPSGRILTGCDLSGNFHVFNPADGTYVSTAHGLGNSNPFYGAALTSTGKVIMAPHNSASVGIFNSNLSVTINHILSTAVI